MSRRKQRKPEPPVVITLRQRSRMLFPEMSLQMRARWVLSRMRVDGGTYRFPIGAMHFETEIPRFLRTLPNGPPLEIHETPAETIRKGGRFVARLVGGKR